MSENECRIKKQFEADHQERLAMLMRLATCAQMASKPWLLPWTGQYNDEWTQNSEMPQAYQSLVGYGINNLVGKSIASILPTGSPWLHLVPSARIQFDPRNDPKAIQQAEELLFMYELTVQATLESAQTKTIDNVRERRVGFRANTIMSLTNLYVLGDVLEQMHDNFRIKVHRNDRYVTKRDDSGDVLYHITQEKKNPLSISFAELEGPDGKKWGSVDEILEFVGIKKDELLKKPVGDRACDLHTNVEWQPETRRWKIEQELNGKVFNTSDETVSPYFSTVGELSAGENYGRGFVEQNLPEIRSFNELTLRHLDMAAMVTKLVTFIRNGSNVRPNDLNRRNGHTIEGAAFAGGQQQDVDFLNVDKAGDFTVGYQIWKQIRAELGQHMLLESETAPTGEAARSPVAWQTIVRQIDGALGGMFAPITDDLLLPKFRRTMHLLQRRKILPILPEGAVDFNMLTGIAAFAREEKAAKLLDFASVCQQLGPEAIAGLDVRVLSEVYARYRGIYEAGLTKTDAQMAKERQQAIAAQAAMEASKKAVDVVGNVAQANAMPPAPTAA